MWGFWEQRPKYLFLKNTCTCGLCLTHFGSLLKHTSHTLPLKTHSLKLQGRRWCHGCYPLQRNVHWGTDCFNGGNCLFRKLLLRTCPPPLWLPPTPCSRAPTLHGNNAERDGEIRDQTDKREIYRSGLDLFMHTSNTPTHFAYTSSKTPKSIKSTHKLANNCVNCAGFITPSSKCTNRQSINWIHMDRHKSNIYRLN